MNINKLSIKLLSKIIFFFVFFATSLSQAQTPTNFIDLQYSYDGTSNVTSIVDNLNPQNNCSMFYDNLDRLTDADGPWGSGTFTYDDAGNRTSKDINGEVVGYTYNTSNRLTNLIYDSNGNITADQNFNYVYDSNNRITEVWSSGVLVRIFEYDALGRRISATDENGDTTYFVYLGDSLNVISEIDSNGIPKFDYVKVGNRTVSRVNFDGNGVKTNTDFYHHDHLGSTIAVTDETTTVVAENFYLPYGAEYEPPDNPFPDQLTDNTHEYTAKEVDKGIGLYYYGARYYNPEIARFMSVDPVGGFVVDPQTFNGYAYVANNPINATDPDGRVLCDGVSTFGDLFAQLAGGSADLLVAYGRNGVDDATFIYLDALRDSFNNTSTLASFCGVKGLAKKTAIKTASFAAKNVDDVGKFVKKGTTVLGKYPDYIKLSDKLDANRFNIPTDIWNKMSRAEQWTANKKFLDRMIRRGDDIVLSNPVKNVDDVSGAFRKELDYLIEQGYKLNSDGTRLIK